LRIAGYHGPATDTYESFVLHRPLFKAKGDRLVLSSLRHNFLHPQEFQAEKRQGAIRFFTFGGSVTYGFALASPTDENFVSQLEQKLIRTQPERRIEAVNCGGICYASYRLVDLVTETLEYSPDFVIIMSGHNEFLEPRHYEDLMKARKKIVSLWYGSRVVWLMQSLASRLQPKELSLADRADPNRMVLAPEYIEEKYIVRDEEEYRYSLEHYTQNLNKMIDLCRNRGVPVILCTLPSNLRSWPPFRSEPNNDALRQRFDLIQNLLSAKQYPEALSNAKAVLADHETAAHFHYAAALSLDKLSRTVEAQEHYLLAKDYDAFPHRTLSSFNERIREIAAKRGVLLFDAETSFFAASPDGIPGMDLFLDQCHPNVAGHKILADGIFKIVTDHGLLGGEGTSRSPRY